MTNTELSWAKSQAWWNDLKKIYNSTSVSESMDLIQFLETQRLEAFAIYMIKDTKIDYSQCQTLAVIAAACIDHVNHPNPGANKAPVSNTEKNPKALRASVELEKVLSISHWAELKTSEKEDILHRRLPKLGFTWDASQEYNGTLFLYKRVVKLVTLR